MSKASISAVKLAGDVLGSIEELERIYWDGHEANDAGTEGVDKLSSWAEPLAMLRKLT